MDNFKHISSLQIRFNDIDVMGHVNNAVYLTFFELGRMTYFNEVFKNSIDWKKEGIILAKAEVDFRIPLRLEDKSLIKVKCSRIGNKSFDFSYQVVKNNAGIEEICATGITVMVCYNYETQKPVPVPAKWIETFRNFENDL